MNTGSKIVVSRVHQKQLRALELMHEFLEETGQESISRNQIDKIVKEHNLPFPGWIIRNDKYRVTWGVFRVPTVEEFLLNQGLDQDLMDRHKEEEKKVKKTNVTVVQKAPIAVKSEEAPAQEPLETAAVEPEEETVAEPESPVASIPASVVNEAAAMLAMAAGLNPAPMAVPTPVATAPIVQVPVPVMIANESVLSLVPKVDPLYHKFGEYEDVRKTIERGEFFPIYISGLSGNGKTFMIEQICAELGRELVRVNITEATDEDDLFGGFRLSNGCTAWHHGPVVKAMQRGAVLLLDEVDLGTVKIMCLQPVLEGKGYLLKKIDQYIEPKKGFTIVATANTKGQGNDSGKFIGANVLNEAFLERFLVTFEQEYPPKDQEKIILQKVFAAEGMDENDPFISHLVEWAEQTRKTYASEACSEIISTRRLVHIARAFSVFKNPKKAVERCINRFDVVTKNTFLEGFESFVAKYEDERRLMENQIRQENERKQKSKSAALGLFANGGNPTAIATPNP